MCVTSTKRLWTWCCSGMDPSDGEGNKRHIASDYRLKGFAHRDCEFLPIMRCESTRVDRPHYELDVLGPLLREEELAGTY